jgi:hypothetical protein
MRAVPSAEKSFARLMRSEPLMYLRLLCPSGHVLDVDARLAGRKIRCGACGKIMLVPLPARPPTMKPVARSASKPLSRSAPRPIAPAPPPSKKSAEAPAVIPPKEIVAPSVRSTIGRRRFGLVIRSWLRNLQPRKEQHVPADVTVPSSGQRRAALRLAGILASTASLGLLPVLFVGHANLLSAPRWALAVVSLTMLQLTYAAALANAPDWAAARVQMVVCAAAATIYGMLMTLAMITPRDRTLILGLDEVRHAAPAWCGLMLVVMGAATWFCGHIGGRWRWNSLHPNDK